MVTPAPVLIAFEKVRHTESIKATDAHFLVEPQISGRFCVCRLALLRMLAKTFQTLTSRRGFTLKRW